MNIAITAEHANIEQLTGVEHYTRELIQALARVDDRNRYTLYLRTAPGAWCDNLPPNFVTRVMPARIAWTQLRVSWEILWRRPDALLVTSFSMPLVHPKKSIVTIHDLAWHLFPETVQIKQRLWLHFTHIFASKFAARLIAVSEQTKRDMIRILKISSGRIDVIHHGFSDQNQETNRKAENPTDQSTSIQQASMAQTPFILCLGTLQPRKNLIRLIDAFLALKDQSPLPHTLVIAGRAGWMCQDVLDKIRSSASVVYLGYVEDRLSLLKQADLLVQPAVYEGFGLSLLDAFSQRVPVACSNVSSLPEVAGDAAEYFDPYSVESMTRAILNVLGSPQRSEELRSLGAHRLRGFSWDDCARKTLATLEASIA
jgi:glycosyltransferase involved in cell wall biosynthesis